MESPYVCNMDALTAEQRSRHNVLAKQIRPVVIEIKELPDGYAARFLPDGEMVLAIAEFITLSGSAVLSSRSLWRLKASRDRSG